MSRGDFHTHSTCSDGILTPTQLIDLAASRGVRVMALTDHDTLDGQDEAATAAARHPGFLLVPGVELSCDVPGTEVHMLGLFVDSTHAPLRSQLKRLHKQFGFTMVYVTHDQTEALTFADKVVVMYDGGIVQIGTPAELFERPSHTFVGYFNGSPGMNVLPVEIDGKTAKFGSLAVVLPGAPEKTGGTMELGIRPEHVRLGRVGIAVSITKVEDVGRHKVVRARLEGHEIAAIIGEDEEIPAEPKLRFDPAGINVYANSWRVEMGA